jgi:hypothetical protein
VLVLVLRAQSAEVRNVVADVARGMAFVHDAVTAAGAVVQLAVVAGAAVGFAVLQVRRGGGAEDVAKVEAGLWGMRAVRTEQEGRGWDSEVGMGGGRELAYLADYSSARPAGGLGVFFAAKQFHLG